MILLFVDCLTMMSPCAPAVAHDVVKMPISLSLPPSDVKPNLNGLAIEAPVAASKPAPGVTLSFTLNGAFP